MNKKIISIIALASLICISSCAYGKNRKADDNQVKLTLEKGDSLVIQIQKFFTKYKRYPSSLVELRDKGFAETSALFTEVKDSDSGVIFFFTHSSSNPPKAFNYNSKDDEFELSFYAYKRDHLNFLNALPFIVSGEDINNSYYYFSNKEKKNYYVKYGETVGNGWIKN